MTTTRHPAPHTGDTTSDIQTLHAGSAARRALADRRHTLLLVILAEVLALLAGAWTHRGTSVVVHPTPMGFTSTLLHNSRMGALVVLAGLVTFGVGGVLLAGYTFFTLGATVVGVVVTRGWHTIATAIAPHALPELTAITLCTMLGAEGMRLLIRRQAGFTSQPRTVVYQLALLLLVAAVLFTVAAYIEASYSHA